MADGSHLVWQMLAHAYSDDLLRLKHVTEEMRSLAQRHAAWTPVVSYALGEYQRIRGDHALALEHVLAALSQLTVGTHQIWPHAAASHVSALCSLERYEDAVQSGERHLDAAETAQLGYFTNYIRMPLALAYARTGQSARGLELAVETLASFQALNTSGINLILAYETCSRVAWCAGEVEQYEHFTSKCADACRNVNVQPLRARLERLLRASNAGAELPEHLRSELLATSIVETTLKSAFRDCNEPQMRAERALQMLLKHSGSHTGCLYLIKGQEAALVAHVGMGPTADLTAGVLELIDAEVRQRGLVTASVDEDASSTSKLVAMHSLVLLCHQTSGGIAVSGVAALEVTTGTRFVHPGALAARLSRMLTEAGDVVPLANE
jgi:hypothetical protein